ncbi:C-C motif chemokine 20-like [Cynoglossus semilaevis]|uniref:C-C motif chemokine 20-like n=1 Tax=Cynoglossus semilaevis TaxID=244447 RepID=A0A3P8W9T1_CYNSE|nr:C-C motif chemokine 20-like [Cynoglossus semilaevis]
MAAKDRTVVLSLLLCFILGSLSPALCSQTGCCTRYNRKPVPFQVIKGYREQSAKENCHIEAIILYTVRNKEVCVTKRDEWVRNTLELLSTKLKKMSKESSGPVMKRRSPSNDGSGSFFSTTDTDSYY